MKKYLLLLLFLWGTNPSAMAQVDSVLFVGNSYTAYNNLPNLFANLAQSGGDTFFVESITGGGFTFELHATTASHVAKMQSREWDYFILQEQSMVPTIDYHFAAITQSYAPALINHLEMVNPCGQALFFMTWGRKNGGKQCDPWNTHCSVAFSDFDHMQDTLKSRYLQVASANAGGVSPVGEAWRLALSDTTGLDLHTSDNSHPNLKGSYLAACVHYASITKKSPVGLSFTSTLNTGMAHYLQRKAAEAVLDSLTRYNLDTVDAYVSQEICAGDSVVLGPSVYRSPGRYQDTLTTLNACDSVVQLRLTVLDTNQTSRSYTVQTDTTINGITYTSDTIFNDTLQNQAGCDSIVEITLTFDPQSVDKLLGGNLQLYPNPASSRVTLETQDLAGLKRYRLQSTTGATIRSGAFTEQRHQIPVDDLPKGLYFLELIHQEQRAVRRLVLE